MSERNTGLFVPGHLPAAALARALDGAPERPHLVGAEAPRLGHGARGGRPYSHIGLRLFEVAGLRLMDDDALPPPGDLERRLGEALSRAAGRAVFAFYDEEHGAGGAAVFVDGALVDRRCYDARGLGPVAREGGATRALVGLDPSDWIWTPASDAIEAALLPIVGPGVRTDDELAALIAACAAAPAEPPPPPAPAPAPRARRRDQLLGWLKRG